MTEEQDYTSIIGTSFLIPLELSLLELSKKQHKRNDVQTSPFENGHSSAAILTLGAMLESFLMRAVLFEENRKEANTYRWSDFTKKFQLSQKDLLYLDELYTLRNCIAHNHFWYGTYYYDDDFNMVPGEFSKLEHRNKVFERVVDIDQKCTKLLKLNIFPTAINKIDVIKATIIAFRHLFKIEEFDRRYCYLSVRALQWENKPLSVKEFCEQIWELMGEQIPEDFVVNDFR